MIKNRLYYYTRNPSRDNRTSLARAIDLLLALMLVWLPTALAMKIMPLSQTWSGILTVPALALGAGLVFWQQRRKNKSRRQHQNIWYSARKCRQRIKQLAAPEDFARLVKELLQATLPVTRLQAPAPGGESTISLLGYLRHRQVGVMCINRQTDGQPITAAEISKFFAELKLARLPAGIIVTTDSFADDAKRLVSRLRGQVQIHLLDGDAVLYMARQAKHPIFQDEKWPGEKESRLSGLAVALSIKENLMVSRRKAWSFLLLGISLLVISTWQSGITETIYLAGGIVNLSAGFPGLLLSYLHRSEPFMDWQ
ncbi:MAG: restriction endonuclease [Firmicutes bacterium]|nr:restriction endonuclease [Bacillota bacterium]